MKKGEVKKGFKPFRSVSQDKQSSLKRLRSCSTCEFYYGEPEEECHNNNVTKFDVTLEGDNTFCTFWRPVGMKSRD